MLSRIAMSLACASLLAAAPAFAETAAPAPKAETAKGTPQTHHCYKDGKLQADLTHKKCTAEGGAWKKDVGVKEAAPKTEPKAEPAAVPAPAK